MKIENINRLINESLNSPFVESNKENYADFSTFLKEAIADVNRYQVESQRLDALFASGQTDNIDELIIAAEKANIALQLMVEIKNKVMDAYQEIMRLQL